MTIPAVSTVWNNNTVSTNTGQGQVSTASTWPNLSSASTTELFENTIRNWRTLRSVQSPSEVRAPQTTQRLSAESSQTVPESIPPVKSLKRPERVIGLKRWTGLIIEIAADMLTVDLTPTGHEGRRFRADFELSLLSPDDATAEPGDVVYLTTRHVRATSGYSTVTTELRLRRAGQWSHDEVAEIMQLAQQHAAYFENDE